MFGGIKKMLGIEGVKIDIEIDQPISKKSSLITGHVKLTTLNESTVIGVALKMVEKYQRGRSNSKLINEYTIGFVELEETFHLDKNDVIMIPFELPFKLNQSEMDKIEDSNFIASGIVKLAKFAKQVKSEYRIEAEAIVTGTKLNPLCKKEVILK
jgi:hypothetical protein